MRHYFAVALCLFAHEVTAQEAAPLTIDRAVARAIAGNRDIAVLRLDVEARAAQLRQAARLPNPRFSAAIENVGAEVAAQESTASIGQLIELGGDRRARRDVASAALEVARLQLELAEVDVIAQVKSAFAEALAAQQALSIAKENLELVSMLARATRDRVEAGRTAAIEEVRANVTLSSERLELDAAETRLLVARQQLAATMGDHEASFDSVDGNLEQLSSPPDVERLIDSAVAIRRAMVVIAEREAAMRIEQARSVPDLEAKAGYRAFENETGGAAVAEVSISLPLFDRNRDAISAARAGVESGRAEVAAIRLRLTRDVASASAREKAAARRVATLRSEILPAAEEVFEAVSEGYRLGKFGYLEVVEARRTLASSRRQLVEALEELALSRTELERLTRSAR